MRPNAEGEAPTCDGLQAADWLVSEVLDSDFRHHLIQGASLE